MPMVTQTHRPDVEAEAADNVSPLPAAHSTPTDVPMNSDEASPTGHIVTDAYAEAADQTGAVKDTKQVPEPDSLGG
jgi:hypothetical protein